MRIFKAALFWVVLVMLAGTALGALRELFVRPRVGLELALALELPFMIAVSALTARHVVRRFRIEPRVARRAALGACGLALLLLAEDLLSRALGGVSLLEHWAGYGALAVALSLLGLAAFAAMPLLLLLRLQESPTVSTPAPPRGAAGRLLRQEDPS